MSRNLYDLIGLAAGICFILALKGLSSPKSARRGNLIGALGATLATVIVFFYANEGKALNNQTLILAAIGFGVLVGVPAARKVQMTQMPQLVELFNGVGGGAAAQPQAAHDRRRLPASAGDATEVEAVGARHSVAVENACAWPSLTPPAAPPIRFSGLAMPPTT